MFDVQNLGNKTSTMTEGKSFLQRSDAHPLA
jgi:hypothetical protein